MHRPSVFEQIDVRELGPVDERRVRFLSGRQRWPAMTSGLTGVIVFLSLEQVGEDR